MKNKPPTSLFIRIQKIYFCHRFCIVDFGKIDTRQTVNMAIRLDNGIGVIKGDIHNNISVIQQNANRYGADSDKRQQHEQYRLSIAFRNIINTSEDEQNSKKRGSYRIEHL